MKRKMFFAILGVTLLAGSLFFWRENFSQKEAEKKLDSKQDLQVVEEVTKKEDAQIDLKNEQNEAGDKVEKQVEKLEARKVPFTSQAPLGNWSDERFQNGCEEASVAMAMRWIKNKTFASSDEAQTEITSIAKFEEKTFGNYIDASMEQVGEIFSQYYDFKNFSISRKITVDDLKSELEKGNVVLVPTFGRALRNPNYTQPGPITHMLVLVGYDAKTKEFITNDPGTKKGENYRYGEKVLFDAIWAYPAGKNHPEVPDSIRDKAMLVVGHSKEL